MNEIILLNRYNYCKDPRNNLDASLPRAIKCAAASHAVRPFPIHSIAYRLRYVFPQKLHYLNIR